MNPVHFTLSRPATLPKNGALVYGAVTSFVAHAFAAACLWAMAAKPQTTPSAPIMVSLVMTAEPAPVPVEPRILPRPRPLQRKPLPPRPQPLLVAAPMESTQSADVAPALQAPTESAMAVALAPQAAVVPPRFDAAYLDNPPPPYPSLARRLGEQGRVTLRVLVSAEGAAAQVELKNSSGSLRLDQSALGAVKRWRFVPAKQGTQAIAAWVLVPISFTLGG